MNLQYDWSDLSEPAVIVAPRLLGSVLVREINGVQVSGRIVETEAYNQSDAASHSFKGRTPRTEIMFGPAGFLYVYFTYGMHYCCNVVTGEDGVGEAVLIRAVEPLGDHDKQAMGVNRKGRTGVDITNGPAKLCQALQIEKSLNGHDLRTSPLRLQLQPALAEADIVRTTRIGISQAKDEPWRFYIRGNSYVSKTISKL